MYFFLYFLPVCLSGCAGFGALAVGWAEVHRPQCLPQAALIALHRGAVQSGRGLDLDQRQDLLLQGRRLLACERAAGGRQRIPTEQEGALDAVLKLDHPGAAGIKRFHKRHWQPGDLSSSDWLWIVMLKKKVGIDFISLDSDQATPPLWGRKSFARLTSWVQMWLRELCKLFVWSQGEIKGGLLFFSLTHVLDYVC